MLADITSDELQTSHVNDFESASSACSTCVGVFLLLLLLLLLLMKISVPIIATYYTTVLYNSFKVQCLLQLLSMCFCHVCLPVHCNGIMHLRWRPRHRLQGGMSPAVPPCLMMRPPQTCIGWLRLPSGKLAMNIMRSATMPNLATGNLMTSILHGLECSCGIRRLRYRLQLFSHMLCSQAIALS